MLRIFVRPSIFLSVSLSRSVPGFGSLSRRELDPKSDPDPKKILWIRNPDANKVDAGRRNDLGICFNN